MATLTDLLRKNRSYRRFHEQERISRETLLELLDLVRLCPSGRNAQPLRYHIACTPEACAAIFPNLAWAGYLTDWDGPAPGERPAAYLIQCLDTRIVPDCLCDDGIQLQTLLLGATERGLGGCIIKAFRNQPLRELLALPEYLKINYVLALGVPAETVFLEPMRGDDCKYWRDAQGIHHVPKRSLEELLIP